MRGAACLLVIGLLGPARAARAREPGPDAGPIIELPPDADQPPPPPAEPERGEDAVRTSLFGSLGAKAAAIVNRTVIGGYGELPLTVPEHGDSFFEARRLVFFFYSPIHPRIAFSTEVELELGGTPTKRDGKPESGEVLLEFAVVDFRVIEELILRAGVILVPFGKLNINHDSPTRDLTDRPLVTRTIIPSTWFEAGAGALGSRRFGDWQLGYEAYAINGLDSRIYDGLGNRAARGSLGQDNNDDKALVGRVGLGWFGRLAGAGAQAELGASYYDGAYNRAGARARLIGADLTVKLGRLELLGEVVRQLNQPGFDDDYADSTRQAVPEDLWGFYAQLNYHFFPAVLRRRLPADLQASTFTAVALYERVDTDMAVTSENDRTRLVLGLNYRPIEAFVWKHELQRNDSAAGPPSHDYVTSVAWLF